jgi:YjjI family glycine radical enzyme
MKIMKVYSESQIRIENILESKKLQYHEKRANLAREAEDSLPYVEVSVAVIEAMKKGILHDMNEGNHPYRPRYILPDYVKYLKQGSPYLNIEPPKDFYEAINALMVIYRYVPSITGYPVYVGQIDDCLEPFLDTVSEEVAENLLRMLLIYMDRTLPSSFVHMNIGPKDTRIGRLVIKLERELKKTIPNVSLKYEEGVTPDDFAKVAIESALVNIKPYFVNHKLISSQLGLDYAVVSCYNTLRIGGGAHCLSRINLKEIAKTSTGVEDFLDVQLKKAVDVLIELVNARTKYLVEVSKFFETSFLATEGIISLDKFTTMPAVYGLYECIEVLIDKKMGKSQEANDLAEKISKKFYDYVKAAPAIYCGGTNNKHGVHAQSNIDTDIDITPGVRIKYGEEPGVFEHINCSSKLHKYFDTGCSDIYVFEETAKDNIDGMLRIIKGAMKNDIRVLSCNCDSTDFIRITGYLVKKSDMEKYFNGEILREDSVMLGAESYYPGHLVDRKAKKVDESFNK